MNAYPEKQELQPVRRLAKLSGYGGLYLSAGFLSLGMNLISLFIPLYILKLTSSLGSIFLFYALYHLVTVISTYPTARLIRRFGVDLVGFVGAILRTIFIYFLVQAETKTGLIWLAAAIWGSTVSFTWLPFHYSFTVAEDEDGKYGKEVGQLQVIYRLAGLVGPAAGGLITAAFGFRALFSLTMVLTLVSGLPLFFDAISSRGMRLSFEKVIEHLKKKKRRRLWLSLVGGQLEMTVVGLVWPLFIYLSIGGYEKIGLIKSAAALLSAVMVWFLGRYIDRRGKSVLHLGTVVNGFNLLIRSFLATGAGLFLADASYSITSGLVATPFNSAFYEKAAKMRRLEFVVERELVLHLAGVMICGLIGFLIVFQADWFWLFSLGTLGLWWQNFILAKKNGRKK